jgi:hypothetical protein
MKIQMGDSPDSVQKVDVALDIPLDESPNRVAEHLVRSARLALKARELLNGPCSGARVVSVDGHNCSITVSHGSEMNDEVSKLVNPLGWDN